MDEIVVLYQKLLLNASPGIARHIPDTPHKAPPTNTPTIVTNPFIRTLLPTMSVMQYYYAKKLNNGQNYKDPKHVA